MDYIKSIVKAFKMIINGQLSVGALMSVGGCVLFVAGIVLLCALVRKNRKQREQLYESLRNS